MGVSGIGASGERRHRNPEALRDDGGGLVPGPIRCRPPWADTAWPMAVGGAPVIHWDGIQGRGLEVRMLRTKREWARGLQQASPLDAWPEAAEGQ